MRSILEWIFALLLVVVSAKRIQFKINDGETNFRFVDKFCFGSEGGEWTLEYRAPNTPEYQFQKLAIYPSHMWEKVYDVNGVDCLDKVSTEMSYYTTFGNKMTTVETVDNYTIASMTIDIKYSRPSYWFLALANCPHFTVDSGGYATRTYKGNALNAELSLTMLNNGEPAWTKREFGVPYQNVFQWTIFFCCWYTMILLGCVYIKKLCKQQGLQYKIVKGLAVAVFMSWLGCVVHMVYLGQYSKEGAADTGIESFAHILYIVADLALLCKLCDLADGYTISTNNISRRRTYVVMLVLLVILLITHTAGRYRDRASTEYEYESNAGYLALAAQLCVFVWVELQVWRSYNTEREQRKQQWYITYSIFAGLWLLSVPITVLVGLELPAHTRNRTVFIVRQLCTALAYVGLALMFTPAGWIPFNVILNPEDWGSNSRPSGVIVPSTLLSQRDPFDGIIPSNEGNALQGGGGDAEALEKR